MAYFPNGSDAETYFSRFCDRCVHQKGCPVLELHIEWNYDAVGTNGTNKHALGAKQHALDTLWPREGVHNGDCRMFVETAGQKES